jgi:hypothetical protein
VGWVGAKLIAMAQLVPSSYWIPLCFLLLLLLLLLCVETTVAALSRDDFPPGFIFGAGASAFQVRLYVKLNFTLHRATNLKGKNHNKLTNQEKGTK